MAENEKKIASALPEEEAVKTAKTRSKSVSASKKSVRKEYMCENLSFAAKEAYKRLRTNIQFSFADGEHSHAIGITSAQPSDGKSLTALNFAYTLAEMKMKVLLIDADMRKPTMHEKLDINQTPGLSNLLVNVNNIGSLIHKYKSSTDSTVIDIITAGDIPPNPAELLSSEKMKQLIARLKEAYDYIVIDLPPVGAVTDAQSVARIVDGMLVVIRENNSPRELVGDCVEQLKYANARILGFVVNGSTEGSKGYGYGKKYGYGYGYGYGYYK